MTDPQPDPRPDLRARILAASREVHALAAARRRARLPSPDVARASDVAVALDTLLVSRLAYGGRIPWKASDPDVLVILHRHGIDDLVGVPTQAR